MGKTKYLLVISYYNKKFQIVYKSIIKFLFYIIFILKYKNSLFYVFSSKYFYNKFKYLINK